jgi:hypothetical protein
MVDVQEEAETQGRSRDIEARHRWKSQFPRTFVEVIEIAPLFGRWMRGQIPQDVYSSVKNVPKAAIKTSGLENAGTRYCARASRWLQARKFLDPIKRSTWFGRTLSGVMSVQTWRRFGYCVRKTNSSETAQPISSANTTHLPNRGCALGNPSM